MRLILASASPRRAALLRDAGYDFVVETADVDEAQYLGKLPPAELAAFLAPAKAQAVAPRFPNDVILAADTVVALNDTSLGKPADPSAARDMIRLLSGTTHLVITGVAVRRHDRNIRLDAVETSRVQMRLLSPAEIDAYVASDRWRGKAGGYGIQDPDPIVACVSGSASNVVGLPMEATARLLEEAGITPDNNRSGRRSNPVV